MLVLLAVKVLEVEEAGRLGLADGVQAVQDGDRVYRYTERGVPKQNKRVSILIIKYRNKQSRL